VTYRIHQQEYWPRERYRPHPDNPRTITREQARRLRRSIEEFGLPDPLIARLEDGLGIGGHQRWIVIEQILEEKNPEDPDDAEWLQNRNMPGGRIPVVPIEGITDEHAIALNIALNNPDLQGRYDPAKLAEVISRIDARGFDATLTGFDMGAIEKMVTFTGGNGRRAPDKFEPKPTEEIEAEEPWKADTQPGEVVELGAHRLICAPCEIRDSWAHVPEAVRFDLVFTDPPYGVDYEGKIKKRLKIENDALTPEQTVALLSKSFLLASEHCEPAAVWYVCAPSGPEGYPFATVLKEMGIWRQTLAWVKDSFVIGRSDFHYKHEHLYYGWLPGGGRHYFCGSRALDTVWEIPRPKKSPEHPTIKPVALYQRGIEYSTEPGALILDMFAGFGTAIIAAQQTGRIAWAFEKDPRYCDEIRRRWREFTAQGVLV
jgi:hypothetical protein